MKISDILIPLMLMFISILVPLWQTVYYLKEVYMKLFEIKQSLDGIKFKM